MNNPNKNCSCIQDMGVFGLRLSLVSLLVLPTNASIGLDIKHSISLSSVTWTVETKIQYESQEIPTILELGFSDETTNVGIQGYPMVLYMPFSQFIVNGTGVTLNVWDMISPGETLTVCHIETLYKGNVIDNGCTSTFQKINLQCTQSRECSFEGYGNNKHHRFLIRFGNSRHLISNVYSGCETLHITADGVILDTLQCSEVTFVPVVYSVLSVLQLRGTYKLTKTETSFSVELFPHSAEYDTLFYTTIIFLCTITSIYILRVRYAAKYNNDLTYAMDTLTPITVFVISLTSGYVTTGVIYSAFSHGDTITHVYFNTDYIDTAMWLHAAVNVIITVYVHKTTIYMFWKKTPSNNMFKSNFLKSWMHRIDPIPRDKQKSQLIVYCAAVWYQCFTGIYFHLTSELGSPMKEYIGMLLAVAILSLLATDCIDILQYLGYSGIWFLSSAAFHVWIFMLLAFVESVRAFPEETYIIVSLSLVTNLFAIVLYISILQ